MNLQAQVADIGPNPEQYLTIHGVPINSVRIRPHHVLIRWLKRTETRGGILLPQNRQRKNYMMGRVLGVGPDCDPAIVRGVKVQFDSMADKDWDGAQSQGDRDPVFFIREEDLHGIVLEAEGTEPSLVPLNDIIMVRPDVKATEQNGLALPSAPKNGPVKTGTIFAVSDQVTQSPKWLSLEIHGGQRVGYKASGPLFREINFAQKPYDLVDISYLEAILEDQ